MKRAVGVGMAILLVAIAALVWIRRPTEEQRKTVYWAIRDGEVDRLRVLFNENPRLVEATYSDAWPLVHATGIYSPVPNRNAIVALLLTRGADPNRGGWRALSGCIYSNDGECIQLLLDHGADPLLKDPEGKTALDYARSSAAGGIAEIIEDHLKKEGRL